MGERYAGPANRSPRPQSLHLGMATTAGKEIMTPHAYMFLAGMLFVLFLNSIPHGPLSVTVFLVFAYVFWCGWTGRES